MTTTAISGCYVLLLHLERTTDLTIGRLGSFVFPSGTYAYIGSALGGVEQRVARHLRPSVVRHWHIDYLRQTATIRGVHAFAGGRWGECALAQAVLALPGASIPVPRFGSSDCRCPSHLVHLPPPGRSARRRGEREHALALG